MSGWALAALALAAAAGIAAAVRQELELRRRRRGAAARLARGDERRVRAQQRDQVGHNVIALPHRRRDGGRP